MALGTYPSWRIFVGMEVLPARTDPLTFGDQECRHYLLSWAKARGHFVEAQILEACEVDFIDESEVLTMASMIHHNKDPPSVPFVCVDAVTLVRLFAVSLKEHPCHQG
jgi:hypothetical protein